MSLQVLHQSMSNSKPLASVGGLSLILSRGACLYYSSPIFWLFDLKVCNEMGLCKFCGIYIAACFSCCCTVFCGLLSNGWQHGWPMHYFWASECMQN